MFSSIAMGIIQILCLKYEGKIRVSGFRYLRTSSQQVMSEAGMMEFLRRNLFRFMAQQGGSTISKIISDNLLSSSLIKHTSPNRIEIIFPGGIIIKLVLFLFMLCF